jgi:pyridoxal phosphate enzyme (YggS family)
MRSVILDNLEKIRYRIDSAAARAGRDPQSVLLVVVTKYAPLEAVRQVCESGLVREIAENRVQDAEKKMQELGEAARKVRWRMIGHLQTNKAKKAAELFDSVDSVDSLKLAAALDAAAGRFGKKLPVLLQVKLSAKETQSGTAPEDIGALLQAVKGLRNLEVQGLMAIAPQAYRPDEARTAFRRMRSLFDSFFKDQPGARLSMGMSGDFDVAVEEGSNMVRLGRVVFT